VLSVDGILYSVVSKTPGPGWSGPFRGIKLLKSADNGKTWCRVDRFGRERKMPPHDPGWNEVTPPSGEGGDATGNAGIEGRKGVYELRAVIYSPERACAHKLLLARVEKEKIGVRSAWEYFMRHEGGRPVWTSDIRKRGYVLEFPEKSKDGSYFGWYSHLPCVVWNEELGVCIMVTGGTYAGKGMSASDADYHSAWMHTRTGSLGFWYAYRPWGPWRRFFYTDYWTADDPRNLTYQPKLSPKWISKDGRRMVLIWSDAMKNREGKSHTVNYKWNQMQITILTK